MYHLYRGGARVSVAVLGRLPHGQDCCHRCCMCHEARATHNALGHAAAQAAQAADAAAGTGCQHQACMLNETLRLMFLSVCLVMMSMVRRTDTWRQRGYYCDCSTFVFRLALTSTDERHVRCVEVLSILNDLTLYRANSCLQLRAKPMHYMTARVTHQF